MTYPYFLFSPYKNRIYVSVTSDIVERLKKHNDHTYIKAYSKIASDWEIIFQKAYQNKKDALYLERFIKKMKSRKFIDKILRQPHILDDILLHKK